MRVNPAIFKLHATVLFWKFTAQPGVNSLGAPPYKLAVRMSLAQKQAQLIAQLAMIKNSQERFAYVVRRGREYPCLEAALKTETTLLEGCLSKVWFVPQLTAGRCYFKTDSDSAIVKGISVILCEFYSGEAPEEILRTPPSFLEQVGINQHLTPNKRHSLTKIWGRIEGFAAIHSQVN